MPFDGVLEGHAEWQTKLKARIRYWEKWLAKRSHWVKPPRATIDFETRSAFDLMKGGGWLYSKHVSTEAVCLAIKLPDGHRAFWHQDHAYSYHHHKPDGSVESFGDNGFLIAESAPPEELFAFIIAGGKVEAHNSFFERCIWKNVMAARHGWPAISHDQWMCSAAKASAMSLPRALGNAVEAMGLPIEKDMEGNKLMRKMSKPRKLKKDEVAWLKEQGYNPAEIISYHETEEDIYRQWDYCQTDILAEEALSEALPDLSEYETRIWKMDQAINERGMRFDIAMARAALDIADQWKAKLNAELYQITGIERGSMRAKVKQWLEDNEQLVVPDTTAETLDYYLKYKEMSDRARNIIYILKEVNRTSTSKYVSMLKGHDEVDECIRDLLMYCGAGTGRWSGKGVQIHNFPARDLMVKDFEEAADAIKSCNLDWCIALYGYDIMQFLSHALRGAIIPRPGFHLMVADYSAIEARCVLWLAEATGALDVFRTGGDIYCDMATGIYGYDVQKKTHPNERQFGKQAILGLGYGMGFVTFLLTCKKYDISFTVEQVKGIVGAVQYKELTKWVRGQLNLDNDAQSKSSKAQAARYKAMLREKRMNPSEVVHELVLMKHTVNIYRERYEEVRKMWKAQEAAAILAVQKYKDLCKQAAEKGEPKPTKGPRVKCGKVTWFIEDDFLKCELPSGRHMCYREPRVRTKTTSWGEARPHLSYMSIVKGKFWLRVGTYGGKIVENITQAMARDIMADAMLLAHEGDTYFPLMSVHDELVAEVAEKEGSIDEFETLMSSILPWADGCPITAEAERMTRYKK